MPEPSTGTTQPTITAQPTSTVSQPVQLLPKLGHAYAVIELTDAVHRLMIQLLAQSMNTQAARFCQPDFGLMALALSNCESMLKYVHPDMLHDYRLTARHTDDGLHIELSSGPTEKPDIHLDYRVNLENKEEGVYGPAPGTRERLLVCGRHAVPGSSQPIVGHFTYHRDPFCNARVHWANTPPAFDPVQSLTYALAVQRSPEQP
ncbi:hypothetical protein NQT62_14070 [Limnobacter humi]|uniref:Uncharacterized protein n=1 Tax=Limnobacter humi TaxID=1778671 RepID=A0ABT1WL75_9BURK|nr:hypothetical protein [Limnobacter humi]MCQ8897564.1 hypothetical protein [Limnobacter humi]